MQKPFAVDNFLRYLPFLNAQPDLGLEHLIEVFVNLSGISSITGRSFSIEEDPLSFIRFALKRKDDEFKLHQTYNPNEEDIRNLHNDIVHVLHPLVMQAHVDWLVIEGPTERAFEFQDLYDSYFTRKTGYSADSSETMPLNKDLSEAESLMKKITSILPLELVRSRIPVNQLPLMFSWQTEYDEEKRIYGQDMEMWLSLASLLSTEWWIKYIGVCAYCGRIFEQTRIDRAWCMESHRRKLRSKG